MLAYAGQLKSHQKPMRDGALLLYSLEFVGHHHMKMINSCVSIYLRSLFGHNWKNWIDSSFKLKLDGVSTTFTLNDLSAIYFSWLSC